MQSLVVVMFSLGLRGLGMAGIIDQTLFCCPSTGVYPAMDC